VFSFLNTVPAAFLTEIATATRMSLEEIARVLASEPSRVVVVSNPPPDRHVTADQRVASLITDTGEQAARERSARYWQAWVREYMAAHRCG
jgi:hypothetical protein